MDGRPSVAGRGDPATGGGDPAAGVVDPAAGVEDPAAGGGDPAAGGLVWSGSDGSSVWLGLALVAVTVKRSMRRLENTRMDLDR